MSVAYPNLPVVFVAKIDDYKKEKINYKLIYDAKRDGQNYSNCHSKCNNVPNTLSLVTTNNDKNTKVIVI